MPAKGSAQMPVVQLKGSGQPFKGVAAPDQRERAAQQGRRNVEQAGGAMHDPGQGPDQLGRGKRPAVMDEEAPAGGGGVLDAVCYGARQILDEDQASPVVDGAQGQRRRV